jgi:hypothetical protein
MSSTQVTTWRRYTAAEKKAYRARELKRRSGGRGLTAGLWIEDEIRHFHHFADNFGSGVPTLPVNGERL